jgi:hypothetical protein
MPHRGGRKFFDSRLDSWGVYFCFIPFPIGADFIDIAENAAENRLDA